MKSSHPHWLRSAIIASIGLALALVSVVWVGIVIRSAGPQTISLAYRIDRKELLAFVRTTDEEGFRKAILDTNQLLNAETLPALPELPKGVSYEYALMTGSGTQSWIVLVHMRNQEQKMFESSEAHHLLSVDRIGNSFGTSGFFHTQGGKKSPNCTFINLEKAAFASSREHESLRVMLSPFSGMLRTVNNKNGNLLILEKKNSSLPLLSGIAPIAIGVEKDPLFSLSIGHPLTLFAALKRDMETPNGSFLEGLQGILQYRLEALTHRSDIEGAIDDLGRNGLSVSLFPKESGQRILLLTEGKDKNSVDEWLERMRSVTTPAVIRAQTFLHGNSRTDVIAGPLEGNFKTENGWMLLTSSSGSTESLSVAAKGTTMLFSNDDSLLKAGRNTVDEPHDDVQHPKAQIRGTLDSDWLVRTLRAEGTELQSILGTGARIMWEATDEGDAVEVRYSITKA